MRRCDLRVNASTVVALATSRARPGGHSPSATAQQYGLAVCTAVLAQFTGCESVQQAHTSDAVGEAGGAAGRDWTFFDFFFVPRWRCKLPFWPWLCLGLAALWVPVGAEQ